MLKDQYDVVIAGGGPGGSVAAGFLAKAGHSVLLVEREVFPRFHIGESMLPRMVPVFDALGFSMDEVPHVRKAGADFLKESSEEFGRFLFANGLDGTPGHAWQVERAVFDLALLNHARICGAEVRQRAQVDSIEVGDSSVTITLSDRSESPAPLKTQARFFIDATGRSRFGTRVHKSYEPVRSFGLAAASAHFEGVSPEAMAELEAYGNVTVIRTETGWGWVIPLPNSRLGVGFVTAVKGTISEAYFEAHCRECEFVTRLTKGATRTDITIHGDYSYQNTKRISPRFACVGDSGGFLDPVFSSGVCLAVVSAEKLAMDLSDALSRGAEADTSEFENYDKFVAHGHSVFGAFIDRYYNRGTADSLFFYDDPDPEMKRCVITVLAGDVWRDDNRYQQMLLRNARPLTRASA